MKAIVANVLFGGVFGCLSWSNSAWAEPIPKKPSPSIPHNATFSAKLSSQTDLKDRPRIFSLVDRLLSISPKTLNPSFTRQNELGFPLAKKPYIFKAEQTNLVLGFQNTFWSSVNQDKYWGVTTVEHWGKDLDPELDSPKLNYIDAAPILAAGSSTLTFSGGGNNHLGAQSNLDRDEVDSFNFEQFRGGITYHRGLVEQLTLGVGFVYEDLLVGFTQLTYNSDILPLKTTLSLLTKESATVLHSQIQFKPSQNFVVNYHSEEAKHQFDLNWGIASNLTLVGKGDSQQDSYSAGVKVAVHHEFLNLSATAALDNNHNLEWQLSSQLGGFKFFHSYNQQKSTSELTSNLIDSGIGFQCAAFINYQTQPVKQEPEDFMVWGGKLHSATQIRQNTDRWSLDLGYGSGAHGKGFIVKGAIALKPNLVLNLDYQEISAVSDETKVKLQLSSQ